MAAFGWDLVMVVTLDTSLAGRHSDFVDLTPVAQAAGAALLPVVNVNNADMVDRIAAARPDYIFVVGWSQICRAELLSLCPGRVVGYHPAALPRLRGRAAIPWTILNDEKITAGTLFTIGEGLDDGPILEQKFFHIAEDENATTLYARHMGALSDMMDRLLPRLLTGAVKGEPQEERYASWAARRTREDGRIDWRKDAADILRLIRAVTRPYPGAVASLSGEEWSIFNAVPDPESGRHLACPGQVVAHREHGFSVQCGNGTIWIDDWSGPGDALPKIHAIFT